MAKEFNVPPVVFPSGGNPGPQHRRLPTAPFQPPKASTPSIPFMSFDIGSAAASFSTPQFAPSVAGFEDEPPLLEELGINTKQIYQKTLSILNPFRVKTYLHEDADLSGPFLFLMAFGLFQLLAGKLHFGIILGLGDHGFFIPLRGFQHAGRPERGSGSVQVRELDRVLHVAHCHLVCDLSVLARRDGDQCGSRRVCSLVHKSLH